MYRIRLDRETIFIISGIQISVVFMFEVLLFLTHSYPEGGLRELTIFCQKSIKIGNIQVYMVVTHLLLKMIHIIIHLDIFATMFFYAIFLLLQSVLLYCNIRIYMAT